MLLLRCLRSGAAIGLGLFSLCLSARPSEFSLKLSAGGGWLDGGDLNTSIDGWKRYYEDRQSASFSSSYGLGKLRGIFEGQAEVAFRFSARWSAGLSVGFISGATTGDVSTLLSEEQAYAFPSGETGTISLAEESNRLLRHEIKVMSVLVTISRFFPLRSNLELTLGAGGGVYAGRYHHREEYVYYLSSIDTQDTAGGPVQYSDRYELAGEYTEKASARSFGVHGLVGLEYKISPSLAVTLEAVGRWAALDGWEGEKADAYEWSQTWGFGGGFSEKGEFEDSAAGRLWRVNARSELTSGTYPRLIFAAEEPASSSFSSVRPARINVGGISVRVGFRFRFGERR